MLSRPTRGPLDAEDGARHSRAHQREIDELARRGADVGAEVEHDAVASTGSATAPAMAGRSMPGMVLRTSLAMAISAPVLPAETAASASPFFTASIASHMLDAAAAADRLARLVLHLDHGVGVDDRATRSANCGMLLEMGLDARLIAEQQEAHVGMAVEGEAAPGTTTAGPRSPPMASSEMVRGAAMTPV